MILQILKVILQAAKRVWNLPGQIVKTQISACIDNYHIRKGKNRNWERVIHGTRLLNNEHE